MKINPALAMALSALSAGILISCVKPAEENKVPEVDSQSRKRVLLLRLLLKKTVMTLRLQQ